MVWNIRCKICSSGPLCFGINIDEEIRILEIMTSNRPVKSTNNDQDQDQSLTKLFQVPPSGHMVTAGNIMCSIGIWTTEVDIGSSVQS